MNQEAFQQQHHEEWQRFERWLDDHASTRHVKRTAANRLIPAQEFPAALRRVCQQLALAKRRDYSVQLVAYLRGLADRGHQLLYQPRAPRLRRIPDFLGAEFPALVRQHWRAMAVSALLLFLPMAGFALLLQIHPALIHSVFESSQLAGYEAMYDPAKPERWLGRGDGTNLQMFGFYVFNNVSIAFRTFASGLPACIGAVFVLVTNGIIIGGIAGHLTAIGHGQPFWQFVAGHSAPELLAIVISGGAGLVIGMALLAPGRRSRGAALRDAGRVGGKLVLGAFVMLVVAAFVEAYWSSMIWLPGWIKYGAGAVMWLLVSLWLALGGRGTAQAVE